MHWRFSDGTQYTLETRRIEGSSVFANSLSRGLANLDRGLAPGVYLFAPPGGLVDLDPSDPQIVDAWLRELARLHGLEVLEAPTIEPVEDLSTIPTGDPDLFY